MKHPQLPPTDQSRARRALVLITVLWVVALLTVIVTMTAQATRLDVRVGVAAAEQTRTRWACRAGLEKALAILTEDSIAGDCLTDLWSDNIDELEHIPLPRSVCSVRIVDEAGKLNINTAGKDQLAQLPNMTEEIAAAIIDWRDQDDDTDDDGAEIEYYANLPLAYSPRNADFQTIRELLLVKDVTPELLYGEDTNLNGLLDLNENDGAATMPLDNADGLLDQGWLLYLTCYSYDRNRDAQDGARIDINKADQQKLQDALNLSRANAQWIVKNRPQNEYRSIAGLLPTGPSNAANPGNDNKGEPLNVQTFKKIADRITVNTNQQIPGRVNVNTAPRAVLVALLDGDEQVVDDIIAHRDGLAEGMVSIAELLDINSITQQKFKDIAEQITTRSPVFTVYAQATSTRTGGGRHCEAVIDRGQTPSRIVYLYQGANH